MPTNDSNHNVEAVVEALVREHLSKKKFLATLQAFKAEQPKLLGSISKRSALQQILCLQAAAEAEAASSQRQNKPNATTSSTLELWVQHHLKTCAPASKPATVGSSPAALHGVSSVCESRVVSSAKAASRPLDATLDKTAQTPLQEAGKAAPAAYASMSCRTTWPVAAVTASEGTCASDSKSTACGMDQQQQLSALPNSDGTASSLAAAAPQQQQQQVPALGAQAFQNVVLPAFTQQNPAARAVGAAALSSNGRLEALRVGHGDAAATAAPAAAGICRTVPAQQQQLQRELIIEDVDDEPIDATGDLSSSSCSTAAAALPLAGQPAAVPTRLLGNSCSSSSPSSSPTVRNSKGPASSGGSSGGSNALSGLQPLLPEQQRQLSKLMWGDEAAKPYAAWQQGLIFSEKPGLEWGLVQLAGGPCGVLAAVQAHLIATLMEQSLWGAVLQPQQLQSALVSSLATIIWTARCSSTAQVVMLPLASVSAAARGLCDAGQAVRMAHVATADSLHKLEVLLKSALPQWSQRKGWGLLLLLYSLLLTRGCAVIRADMDDSFSALVDSLGYCSMELVNLMLTGTACSNVFDGKKQLGGSSNSSHTTTAATDESSHMLSGVASQARVGLLTLFEWYRYVDVGENLKSPRLPVWVVCSESHFTTLAVAAVHQEASNVCSRGLVDGLSSSIQPTQDAALVLEFYDGMARQERPIHLILKCAEAGRGWSSKMAGVAEDRGTWCGQPIPPLECVCETKWKDVQVVWHGTDPIL